MKHSTNQDLRNQIFLFDYKDQLRTSAWMRKKYEILSRDNFVCSNCLADNYESQLEVHHIAYENGKKAWEYNDYMLVTLCRECHQNEHDKNNIKNPRKIRQWVKKLLITKINQHKNTKL